MNIARLESAFQTLYANKAFEVFVIAIIVFSALVIGAKTYPLPYTKVFLKLIYACTWTILAHGFTVCT